MLFKIYEFFQKEGDVTDIQQLSPKELIITFAHQQTKKKIEFPCLSYVKLSDTLDLGIEIEDISKPYPIPTLEYKETIQYRYSHIFHPWPYILYNIIIMETLKLKGNQFFKSKDYQQAIAVYSEAIQLEPNNQLLYSNRS